MAAYTTVDLVEVYLGLTIDSSSTPSESTVERYIEWVSDEIDHITKGKYLLEESTDIIDLNTDTTATSANTSDSTGAVRLPYALDMVALPNKPVQEIIQVWFNSAFPYDTPVWTEKTVGYGGQVIQNGNYLELIDPADKPMMMAGSVKVRYSYGKQTLPPFVEKLATRMAALEIMTGQQSSSLTQGTGKIQVGDISIDDPGQFSSVFIKQTEESIRTYLSMLGTQNYYLV